MSPAASDSPTGSAPVQQHQAIILPGFGREEQLEIDYTSLLFRTTWTSKSCTDAIWADRCGIPNFKLKAVHYGNNMTLLFKACIHLNRYSASDNFWTAIAHGFRCKAQYVITHLNTLIRARKAYLRQYGNRVKSIATRAIDTWINMVTTRRSIAGDASVPITNDERLFEAAERYFEDAKTSKFLYRDAASVLSAPPEPDMAHRPPKRSRSPSVTYDEEEPFSAGFKRRARLSDGRPLESPSTSRSGWEGLPPLKTDFQESGYDKRPSPVSHPPPHDTKPDEPLGRIRGISNHDSLPPRPSTFVSEGLPQYSPRNDSLEQVNELLQDRTEVLEKKLEIQQKMAALTNRQTMDMLNILEKKLAETEVQRTKESDLAQARIAALEAKLTAQQDQTAASQALLTRIASLEAKLAGKEQPSQGIWGQIKGFEQRLARLEENTTDDPNEEYLKGLISQITSLKGESQHTLQQADVDRGRIELSEKSVHELRQRFTDLTTTVDRLNESLHENQELKPQFKKLTIMVNDIKSSGVSAENFKSLQDKIIMLHDRMDKADQGYARLGEIEILNRQVEENMAQNAVLGERIRSLRESQEITTLRITELVNLLHDSFAS